MLQSVSSIHSSLALWLASTTVRCKVCFLVLLSPVDAIGWSHASPSSLSFWHTPTDFVASLLDKLPVNNAAWIGLHRDLSKNGSIEQWTDGTPVYYSRPIFSQRDIPIVDNYLTRNTAVTHIEVSGGVSAQKACTLMMLSLCARKGVLIQY